MVHVMMNRKTKLQVLYLCIFILLWAAPWRVFADSTPIYERVPQIDPGVYSAVDPVFDQPLRRIIKLVDHDRYDDAMAVLDSLKEAHPDHPAPYFYEAAVYQSWMSVYRIKAFQQEVDTNVDLAIEKGNALLEKRDDPWLNFYIGGAYGHRGFNRFRRNNWIGAYKDGMKGINNFREAIEKDTTLYDVYLGFGSYFYWRTAKSKFLRLLTFWMPDKRDLGIRQLEFCIDHGRYAREEAISVLTAVYFDSNDYKEALRVVEESIRERNYANMIDIYFHGRLMVHFKNWAAVESDFREILERISGYRYPSIGFQVECKYWIARALDARGKHAEALEMAREAYNQNRARNPELELDGPLENFDEIKSQLRDFYSDLFKKYYNPQGTD